MSFQIHCLTEGQVYEVIPPAVTTRAILQEYDVNMLRIMDAASTPLTILVNVTTMKKLSNISDWATLKFLRHKHMGTTYLVGLDHMPAVKFFVSILAQIFGSSYKVFQSREQAIAYLQKEQLI